MSATFAKLNLKSQKQIVVVNVPATFEPELAGLRDVAVARALKGLKEVEFCLAFVTTRREVDALAKPLAKSVKRDGIVWFAYPKGTSKKYQSEVNRDNGWQALRALGFDTVRAVAIDDDWSALRFRRVEFIKR